MIDMHENTPSKLLASDRGPFSPSKTDGTFCCSGALVEAVHSIHELRPSSSRVVGSPCTKYNHQGPAQGQHAQTGQFPCSSGPSPTH